MFNPRTGPYHAYHNLTCTGLLQDEIHPELHHTGESHMMTFCEPSTLTNMVPAH